MLIDTHCHLTFPDFQDDIDDVIARAQQAGVEKVIVPGIDLSSSVAAVRLADRFAAVYAAVGVHPQDANSHIPGQMAPFAELIAHPKVVAIGEIGLDYYRETSPHNKQKQVLHEFMQLASECGLPVIMHNRAAYDDLFAVIKNPDFSNVCGVFHCFSETVSQANEVMSKGYAVSFTGTITFKNSNTRSICLDIPLANQFLETDGPFMAPVPFRGKRNEPAYVREIAMAHGDMRGLSLAEVGQITTAHALTLFPRLGGTEP